MNKAIENCKGLCRFHVACCVILAATLILGGYSGELNTIINVYMGFAILTLGLAQVYFLLVSFYHQFYAK